MDLGPCGRGTLTAEKLDIYICIYIHIFLYIYIDIYILGWLTRDSPCNQVFSFRTPAVLTGMDLGPCGRGTWTAVKLIQAECSAKLVSVHVCASPTVDLAGHR